MRAMQNGWNRRGPLGLLTGLCLAVFVRVPLAAEAASGNLARDLWLERSELAPERLERLPDYCLGGYREQVLPYPAGTDSSTYPLQATGARAEYQVDGLIRLDGDVHLGQGNRTLRAANAELDPTSQLARASGGVRVEEPGIVLQGENASMDLDSNAATLDHVQFVLPAQSLRGTADHLAQDQAGIFSMTGGAFTRCEPGNQNWLISARTVQVEPGEVFGTAEHAVVRVGSVPVFYTPHLRFPVTDDRQSGWLFPNLAYSDSDGVDISVPYYFNLAPNYDATLQPRYMSERGTGLEGEFRHLAGWEETRLTGAYLYRDDRYDGELERDDWEELFEEGQVSGEFEPADRWLYGMEHNGAVGALRTIVDYTAVSDRDYFRDLGSDLAVSSEIQLERRGEVQYVSGGLFARAWAQRFQRLDEGQTDPYQRLPEFDVSYLGQMPGPFEYSLDARYVSFDRDNDDLGGLNAAVGDRAHFEPRLRLPLYRPWGFLTLTGGYRFTSYDLRDVPAAVDPTPERNIGFGSARGGLFFERELSWFGESLVHTLEPELFYLYQEYQDQRQLPRFDASDLTFSYSQLFRDNRFTGLDRIGDANQLSTGVTTRFLNARTGDEYLRASVGTIVYFEDRRVTLTGPPGDDETDPTSGIAAELAASVARRWRARSTVVWDPYDDRVDELGVALQYRPDGRHIINLGYRKRTDQDIDQTDMSLYWPLTRNIAVIGKWNYDVVSGRTIEGFGGIEYNDCCWRLRFMARRFLDSPTGRNLDTVEADDGIFLQIVFKGLAGFGGKMESVLANGIRGYSTEAVDVY